MKSTLLIAVALLATALVGCSDKVEPAKTLPPAKEGGRPTGLEAQ